ncbi:hypothetical protein CEXT_411451 [Caerostris extrusa]|uniref:Uncharacterized protein n=1 Tax=Caerostris extrusa TaxID=172846 RepID=A0AAV4QR71_CAEEX|nr:hypothetical protein CEXT_411451 [Caerostris extrusa]
MESGAKHFYTRSFSHCCIKLRNSERRIFMVRRMCSSYEFCTCPVYLELISSKLRAWGRTRLFQTEHFADLTRQTGGHYFALLLLMTRH